MPSPTWMTRPTESRCTWASCRSNSCRNASDTSSGLSLSMLVNSHALQPLTQARQLRAHRPVEDAVAQDDLHAPQQARIELLVHGDGRPFCLLEPSLYTMPEGVG